MKKQESTIYRRRSDVANSLNSLLPRTSRQWRQAIITWMFTVADKFHTRPNVVAVAAFYIDLSLEKLQILSPRCYQLLSIAAFHLAIKLHDCASSRLFPLSEFIKVANGVFEECEVVAMERKVINALDWHLHPPTPFCFLDAYVTLLPPSENKSTEMIKTRIHESTEKILQAALIENKWKDFQPSNVAYVAILLAVEQIGNHDFDPFACQAFLSAIERTVHLSLQLIHIYEALDPLASKRNDVSRPGSGVGAIKGLRSSEFWYSEEYYQRQ